MATNTEFVNRVLQLTNQFRAQYGLAPLRLNAELNASAQGHSQDMAVQDYFSHIGKNGSTWETRSRDIGYEAQAIGENIAAGQVTPEQVVNTWINSAGHRANLLNPNYRDIGIGYYYLQNDTGSVNYNYYWTQVFGSGDTNPATSLATPLGTLAITPIQRSDSLSSANARDIFSFRLDGNANQSINLNLHNISLGDDADFILYRDVNNNGALDSSDQFLLGSGNSSNADDSINYLAGAGSYLAVVNRYSLGSDGRLDYHLDLSATPYHPTTYSGAFNLLPREINIGQLFRAGSGPQSFNGWVGNSDTVDTYAFSLPSVASGSFHLVNVSLSGLSADADVRIIQDSNNNRIVDSSEVIGSSTNYGTSSELMTLGLQGGEYFVQVYQWSGNTNYQLTFS